MSGAPFSKIGGGVSLDATWDHGQPIPRTWCVADCPFCRESWAIDTRDDTPPLTAQAAADLILPLVAAHRCGEPGPRDREALAAAIADSLRLTIDLHGPITANYTESAAHRAAGHLLSGPLAPAAPGGDGEGLPEEVREAARAADARRRGGYDMDGPSGYEIAYAAGLAARPSPPPGDGEGPPEGEACFLCGKPDGLPVSATGKHDTCAVVYDLGRADVADLRALARAARPALGGDEGEAVERIEAVLRAAATAFSWRGALESVYPTITGPHFGADLRTLLAAVERLTAGSLDAGTTP